MQLIKNLFQRNQPKVDRINLKTRFERISQMGLGTMSKVWKANDRQNQQFVALKLIDREALAKMNARFPGLNRPGEGVVGKSLEHPNIVKTYEFGLSTEDEPFIVMEYIDGYGLQQLIELQNETLLKHRMKWIITMGEALQYFHDQGWIHRDFCPKNILTTTTGQIKLIDFGLAVPNTPPFQAPGNRTGTADYMAPELVRRQRTDQRIDVYSYAVTCYQIFSNQLPYAQGRNLQTIVKNMNQPPKNIRETSPGIPEPVAQIIERGLEKNPDERWQSVREMTIAFRNLVRKRPATPK
ncbi:MAG TPA: serine/threonine protein kinase [Planctomycetaceae bacterium]|nr:serine/threonine protein kinase [Planctomycetaceae bacterium]